MHRGLNRRGFLGSAGLFVPSTSRAAGDKRIVFVPAAMPASLDPIATPSFATRTASMAVFETLYGTDSQLNAMPQMVEGHRMEEDGKHWTFQLRAGLLFHDGGKVTARDCVASLRRWMLKDRVGQALAARLNGIEATGDDTLTVRLAKPLLRLPNMLTKSQLSPPVIMPERLAATDTGTPVDAIIGSGPFRLADLRWKPGDDLDLIRFERYQPRVEASSFLGGRRTVVVDRVLWRIPDDPLQALRDGAADWVEMLPPDLADDALGEPGLMTGRLDEIGNYALLRLNARQGPTANLRVRQAILAGVDQVAVMETVFGAGSGKFIAPVGLFSPGSAFASTAGMDRIDAKQSPRAIKAMLRDAGYLGEPIVIVNPVDDMVLARLTAAVIDELKQIGLKVVERKLDRTAFEAWRSRRRDGDDWSALCDSVPGADHFDPFACSAGPEASGGLWPGWLNDPAAARLRESWIDTPDLAAGRDIAARLQEQVFTSAVFVPLGQWRPTAAWRTTLTRPAEGIVSGVLGYRADLMGNVGTWFAVASGGALGSLARFWLTGAITALTGPRFPYGTLLINVLGSFVIGGVAGMTLTPARVAMHPDLRIFLMVGICGGFTTFSAFSLQMLELLQAGYVVPGLLYAVGSVGLCLLFVWFGWWLGQL